jgi:hypothetical protein
MVVRSETTIVFFSKLGPCAGSPNSPYFAQSRSKAVQIRAQIYTGLALTCQRRVMMIVLAADEGIYLGRAAYHDSSS